MTTPLAGITVLDFGQIYQGPYATMLMAKAGADVIKIEPPGGEPLRRRVMATGGDTTLPMAMLNANKRAVTLNLKSDAGKELLMRMAAKADVLLENFSPGTLDGLGVGYEVLKQVNPRLIYATGTGFGISGPDRDNLAMDFTIQAASGIMSVTGDPDGPPMKAGPTLVDFMGGIHLYAAVMTALLQRTATGRGAVGGGGDAGGGVSDPRVELRLPSEDREGAAAGRQPAGGAVQRAVQRVPDQGRLGRDPCRHRGPLAEPAAGDGPRRSAGRPALRQPRRAGREHGGDRGAGHRLDHRSRQERGRRGGETLQDSRPPRCATRSR